MATEIKMPQLGLTMEEGTEERWLKAEGDPVKAGEPLLEITTDKLTNEVVAMKAENAFIPREIKGVELTEQEQTDLREGKKVYVEGMIAKSGNEFNAFIQVNAERRGVEFIFENDKLFNRQTLGGVELTQKQIEDLNAGKAIFMFFLLF